MEKPRDRLFQEWIDSWADETGLGVPCGEAQADGVPCFELDRDCSKCRGRRSWLTISGHPEHPSFPEHGGKDAALPESN